MSTLFWFSPSPKEQMSLMTNDTLPRLRLNQPLFLYGMIDEVWNSLF
jgi:hypothetical protein